MISIIVPVYNVEKYLNKCVQSIFAQTYTDFELILVDDGSTDECSKMCDMFLNQDDRVRVIHKKNGGLSDARNAGTAIAKGDYLTYVDSDDYVSPDYLESLLTLINKYNVDIAVTGIEIIYEGEKPNKKRQIREYVYTGEEALEKMLYQDTLDTSACAMLIPVELATKNPFPVGKYHEDEFTTYKYYSSANRVAVTTKSQYFYLQRRGSIMHAFGRPSLDELAAADNLVKFCEDNYSNLVKAAESKKFSDYCQVLLSNKNLDIEDNDLYLRIYTYLKSKNTQILFDKKCRKKNRIASIFLFFGINALYLVNEILNRIKNFA